MTLYRALVLVALNQPRPALALLDRAARNIHDDRVDADEIRGAIGLRSAIVAARAAQDHAEHTTRAWDYWDEAAELIRQGRVGQSVHGLEFTPANVAIHGAAVAVELGDMDEAARRDRDIEERTLSALPPERRAHHEIDMSRALVDVGDHSRAEARLASADKIASEMVTFHPTARSVVTHLVNVRRTLPEPLRRLYQRISA